MIRKAFRMSVHPDRQAEYRRRHNPIWPELAETLKAHGVKKYFIFLDSSTGDLFAYAEIESEEQWAAIASTEICKKWWQQMREIMPSNRDASPVSRELELVFDLR